MRTGLTLILFGLFIPCQAIRIPLLRTRQIAHLDN
jgi:hypothetical protein